MGSESRQDKIAELASTIDEMKTTVDELAADSSPDTNLNAISTALDRASDAADDLVEDERDEKA